MTGPLLPQPHGKTAAFVNAVEEKFGRDFARSWLSDRTCRFSDDTVHTLGIAVDKLNQTCEALIAQHGVRVVYCPAVSEGFRREQDAKVGVKRKVGQ